MYKLIFYLLLSLKIMNTYTQSCRFISGVEVEYYASKSKYNIINVSGCITNTSFKGDVRTIRFICSNYNLPVLEKNSVNNMQHLWNINIKSCHLGILEPGAFFNLPQLSDIDMTMTHLKKISAGVFNAVPSISRIDLSRNKISQIEDDAFSNLPELKILYLANNKLTQIKKEWFNNTTNIQTISLIYNSIRAVPLGMFHRWKYLNYLDLSYNYISTIDGPLFKNHVPRLEYVGLHCNHLGIVFLDTFSDSIEFGTIELSENRLNYLPEDLLNNLRVQNISMYGNPWTCPCYDKIYQAFHERDLGVNIFVKPNVCNNNTDMPVCGISLSNTCVEAEDEELTVKMFDYRKRAGCDTVSGRQCKDLNSNDI